MSIHAQSASAHRAVSVPAVTFPNEQTLRPDDLVVGKHFVYLLVTEDGTLVKIGWTTDPFSRFVYLTRLYPEIDLTQSWLIGVDTYKIERILHIIFQMRWQKLEEPKEGHTEWFDGDIVKDAIDMCRRIAQHRERYYPVWKDLQATIDYYRQNPGIYRTRRKQQKRAKKQQRIERTHQTAQRQAIESANAFLAVLFEREFKIQRSDDGEIILVRTVHSSQEPECWETTRRPYSTVWGERLRDAGSIRYDDCWFLIAYGVGFQQIDEQHGRETIRLTHSTEIDCPSLDRGTDLPRLAFRIVWEAIAQRYGHAPLALRHAHDDLMH